MKWTKERSKIERIVPDFWRVSIYGNWRRTKSMHSRRSRMIGWATSGDWLVVQFIQVGTSAEGIRGERNIKIGAKLWTEGCREDKLEAEKILARWSVHSSAPVDFPLARIYLSGFTSTPYGWLIKEISSTASLSIKSISSRLPSWKKFFSVSYRLRWSLIVFAAEKKQE